MLQIKTKEQREKIAEILKSGHTSFWFEDDDDMPFDGVNIDDYISFEDMSRIVDALRSSTDKNTELFEECWKAYRRKGNKKKSKEYWNKLNESEMSQVLPHVKAYVSSRDLQYQKDFERYLRDKVFTTVVYNGNNMVYDPTKSDDGAVYMPVCGGPLSWNDYYKCYLYTGYWSGRIADGYTDDNRPDGASIKLNNARGTICWSAKNKKWEKI